MPAPDPIPDLLKAVNEASGKAFALWITFLTVGIYLAIAIGTTTHLQLLLAGPVKLPLLGVDMPLFAFYGFAPPMFVILHLYVLMQLYLLARLLRLFDDDLRAADMIEQDRRRVRGQLDKFVFTQFLIGASQDAVVVRLFLPAVVWLSFVIGPVLLLLGFQLRFLPYHSIEVTYVHRVALLLDILLLLLLWAKISRSSARQADVPRHRRAFWRVGAEVSVCTLLVAFAVFVATVPGERADQPQLHDWNWNAGFLSQSLWLPAQRLIEPDEDGLKKLTVTLPLSGRDLRQANFMKTDLRKANLEAADLRGAQLLSAKLDSTNLSGADLRLTDLSFANLSFADLSDADLTGANLSGAELGAKLSGAKLDGANLSGAKLDGANLSGADLTNANLSHSTLGRACWLYSGSSCAATTPADLSGAILSGANLNDVDLHDAKLDGQQQLDQACGTDTKLPPGLTLKPCQSQ